MDALTLGQLGEFVYHGTTSAVLDKIRVEGLTPRGWSRPGNYPISKFAISEYYLKATKSKYFSNPNVVYLATYCNWYHAERAATVSGGQPILLKIPTARLKRSRFRVDENCLLQSGRATGHFWKQHDRLHIDGLDWDKSVQKDALFCYASSIPYSLVAEVQQKDKNWIVQTIPL